MRSIVLLLLIPLLAAPVQAQSVSFLAMDVSVDQDLVVVPAKGLTNFVLTIEDRSDDGTARVGGQAPPFSPQPHSLSFEVTPKEQKAGWQIQWVPGGSISSGQTKTYDFRFLNDPTATDAYFEVEINVTMTAPNQEPVYAVLGVTAYSPGLEVFGAVAQAGFQLKPDEFGFVPVRLSNNAIVPRTFDFEILSNPCDLDVQAPPTSTVPAKSAEIIQVQMQGPRDKFWYQSEACTFNIEVTPRDNLDQARPILIPGQVNGTYIDPTTIFWALSMAAAAFMLLMFLLRRKAILEEELLGKPQRPWTIPAERVYLHHLEQRDPRAAYVVRHFIMEEEYQSALLWYRGFKAATKGTRAKETLVVAQERKYKRFQKKWTRRVAAPIKKADKLEARLQKKLDRKGKSGIKKQRSAWKKQVAKIETAHEAQFKRSHEKWEKAAKKAEKKGQPVPEQPVRGQPDLPPEPTSDRLLLANHKWQKKADKQRKKAVKKQGNLEVKFEKKDAKLLRKVRRKVNKIARKIDDPEFANEHPLMTSAE